MRWTRTSVCLAIVVGAACGGGDGDSGASGTLMPVGDVGAGAPPVAASAPPGSGAPAAPAGGVSDTAGAGGLQQPGEPGAPPPTPSSARGTPIPPECQGFPLDGILYSPGGTTLPNKCEPFHPTWNNPYAVLCVQAWPWYHTEYPGDEYCILPPPPDEGIQIGFHPQELAYWDQVSKGDMKGYANPDSVFALPPGGEITANYLAPVDEPANSYYRTYFRMRTGSHHNIITMHSYEATPRWTGGDLPGLFGGGAGMLRGVLGGQQRPDDSTPLTLEKPPEDAGLYLAWPDRPSVLFNIHFFNSTQGTTLKEGWANIWWEKDKRTLVSWYMGLPPDELLTLSLTPGDVKDYHYYFGVAAPTRLVRVFGHRHVWTTNFSMWIERAGGETELIYQSFDWFDMPTYRYDSQVKNPPLAPETRSDGAVSGAVNLNPGDQFHFNCHIEYTEERAAAENAPSPAAQGHIGFANEVYTGEMCINFGNSVGALGLPVADPTPVPDFAK